MVIGENAKNRDLDVNAVREKKLTNIRTVHKDEALIISPARIMSLEDAIQWIAEDELVEITPKFLRIRKKILKQNLRPKKAKKEKKLKTARS
jgi:GTP-binding protein